MNTYTQNYTYDASTNLLALRHTQNGSTQERTQPVQPRSNRQRLYTYDEAGNQLRTDTLDQLCYGADGQIGRIEWQQGGYRLCEDYTYFQPGVRARKITRTWNAAGVLVGLETTTYIGQVEKRASYRGANLSYDGDTCIGYTTQHRWTVTRIKDGHGQVGTLTKNELTGEETVTYNALNHLDSNELVVDENGNVIRYASYLPYGEPQEVIEADAESKNELGYSGQEQDVTGLLYYGYRYLQGSSGLWNRADPIRFASGQLNLYGMLEGNPVRGRDEMGLMLDQDLRKLEHVVNYILKRGDLGQHHNKAESIRGKLNVWKEHEVKIYGLQNIESLKLDKIADSLIKVYVKSQSSTQTSNERRVKIIRRKSPKKLRQGREALLLVKKHLGRYPWVNLIALYTGSFNDYYFVNDPSLRNNSVRNPVKGLDLSYAAAGLYTRYERAVVHQKMQESNDHIQIFLKKVQKYQIQKNKLAQQVKQTNLLNSYYREAKGRSETINQIQDWKKLSNHKKQALLWKEKLENEDTEYKYQLWKNSEKSLNVAKKNFSKQPKYPDFKVNHYNDALKHVNIELLSRYPGMAETSKHLFTKTHPAPYLFDNPKHYTFASISVHGYTGVAEIGSLYIGNGRIRLTHSYGPRPSLSSTLEKRYILATNHSANPAGRDFFDRIKTLGDIQNALGLGIMKNLCQDDLVKKNSLFKNGRLVEFGTDPFNKSRNSRLIISHLSRGRVNVIPNKSKLTQKDFRLLYKMSLSNNNYWMTKALLMNPRLRQLDIAQTLQHQRHEDRGFFGYMGRKAQLKESALYQIYGDNTISRVQDKNMVIRPYIRNKALVINKDEVLEIQHYDIKNKTFVLKLSGSRGFIRARKKDFKL
ncbi:RHS repeat-associated core domain-containing protein [uncultured Microscilla sp.]|uniref:RHS repeat domain-containing protein n=1 Tax=uncultured Microscilla sp. TaxID=432653 RepID=UPI002608743C|nr:RHS repeat-associated core domain-containing protein [uncultured Microscilla sp.]